jgi:hypothetical protein
LDELKNLNLADLVAVALNVQVVKLEEVKAEPGANITAETSVQTIHAGLTLVAAELRLTVKNLWQ